MKAVIRKSSDPSKWIEDKKYVSRVLRVRGNLKASKNTLDVVYGCAGAKLNDGLGCFGSCYAQRLSERAGMGKTGFHTPVQQIIDEEVLRKDLSKVEKKWLRLGVQGDPAYWWEGTVQVCKIAKEFDLIPVIFTRFWVKPTEDQLRELAESGAWLQTSIFAADSDAYLNGIKRIFKLYEKFGGTTAFRLVSADWDEKNGGKEYKEKQDEMAKWDFNIIEQPLRVIRKSPFYKYLKKDVLFKVDSSGKKLFNSQQYSAGPQYEELPSCWGTKCEECGNQCLTNEIEPEQAVGPDN